MDIQQNQKKSRKINPNSLANLRPDANPGGRPKMSEEYKNLVRSNTVQAILTIIDLMVNSKKEDIRLKASETILDRAYGKAAQPIVGSDEHDPLRVNLLDPEQRRRLINEFIANRQSVID